MNKSSLKESNITMHLIILLLFNEDKEGNKIKCTTSYYLKPTLTTKNIIILFSDFKLTFNGNPFAIPIAYVSSVRE